jgi:hypothetical protein
VIYIYRCELASFPSCSSSLTSHSLSFAYIWKTSTIYGSGILQHVFVHCNGLMSWISTFILFDPELLPFDRNMVSHKVAGWTCINTSTTLATTTPASTTPSEYGTFEQPGFSAMDDPITVASTPDVWTCNWAKCSKSFTSFNDHTLFWVCSCDIHLPYWPSY